MLNGSVKKMQASLRYFLFNVFLFCIGSGAYLSVSVATLADNNNLAEAQPQRDTQIENSNTEEAKPLSDTDTKIKLSRKDDESDNDSVHKNNDSTFLNSLLNQINDLQQEIRNLRGSLEIQQHLIEQLISKTEQYHQDTNDRLSELGARKALPAAVPSNQDKKKDNEDNEDNNEAATRDNVKESAEADFAVYQKAFKLAREEKFDEAITAFDDFITHYPDSQYVCNALYWQGELYSATGKMEKAREVFSKIVNNYPKSSQRADAMYKLGIIFAQDGDKEQAKSSLQQVIKEYPDSSVADLSKKYLKVLS